MSGRSAVASAIRTRPPERSAESVRVGGSSRGVGDTIRVSEWKGQTEELTSVHACFHNSLRFEPTFSSCPCLLPWVLRPLEFRLLASVPASTWRASCSMYYRLIVSGEASCAHVCRLGQCPRCDTGPFDNGVNKVLVHVLIQVEAWAIGHPSEEATQERSTLSENLVR